MNFPELKTTVTDFLNRSDLSGVVGTLINIAMRKIERGDPIGALEIPNGGNFKLMKKEQTGTLLAAVDYLAFPTRFKKVKDNHFLVQRGGVWLPPLERKTLEVVRTTYFDPVTQFATSSAPKIFASDDANSKFVFAPVPDTDYPYSLGYYAYSAELSDGAPTNGWTDGPWEALLYGGLIEAAPYIGDDGRMAVWEKKLAQVLLGLSNAERAEEFSGKQAIRSTGVVI